MRLDPLQTNAGSNHAFDNFVLELFLKQKRRQPLAELLVDFLLAAITYQAVSGLVLASWMMFSIAIHTSYFFLPKWAMRQDNLSAANKLRVISRHSFLNGVTVALPLILFQRMPAVEQAQLSMVYMGLCVGALTTNATYRPIFLRYSLPFLAPLPLLWAISNPPGGAWFNEIMAITLVVFSFAITSMSKDMSQIVSESFNIRQERLELNRQLKSALDSAEAANRAKTRFLAAASHDLRQPMQTLSLFTAALALRPLDDRSRQIAANMNAALHDITGELNALLDVSKLDAGVVQIQPDKIRLHSFLERLHGVFTDAAQEKQLNFTLDCPHDVWIVSDRNHFERIVRNLIENAIKYTDSGNVTIAVRRQQDAYVLSISDTGCGIADSEQPRVFEEFYQVNNPERDRQRGLGLGLSIVKRLTSLLNIPLALTSSPHSGTSFMLTLPSAEPELRIQTPPLGYQQSFCGLHILVIDDEESVRLGMKVLLEELGCSVSLGACTAEAVSEAKRQPPDILLTDFRLRGTDNGIDTIHAVRQFFPELPALIISGDSAPERLLEVQASGITIIHKPVASEALLGELAKLSALRNADPDSSIQERPD